MKFTLSWLKEHLETDADAKTVADTLTSIGLEVEAVEDKGAGLKDFIVAHVVSAEKHPNADKLKLCMVDTGDDIVQVVCGAPNARTGMKAVFARPGVVIPVSGEALKISTIRGVESRGMLCSQRELLLSDEHEGIIELSADAVTGEPAAHALHLNDPVIDISLTPNRGDATSVYGIARDLAAAGLGRLKSGDGCGRAGQIQEPQEHPSRIRARQRKRLSAVRRPPRAQCEERPEPAMGAGTPARHRAYVRSRRWSTSPISSPTTAAGRCMCSMPTSFRAMWSCGWRVTAKSCRRWTARTTRSMPRCASLPTAKARNPSAASWAARKPAARTRRRTSSSKRHCSIRRAWPRRGASSASFPMRAIASSAASIRNSSCRAWSSRRSSFWNSAAASRPNW